MISSLKMIYQRLLDQVDLQHYRFLYDQIRLEEGRLTGLIGARGVGKTTLMLQIIKNQFAQKPVFYLSADHIYFNRTTLYECVEELNLSEGITTFFIDEIHKYKNWSQELKNLYDGFPQIKIMFSGSSSLDLVKGGYDLSRRVKIYHLPGMSFREYINLKTGSQINKISFLDLMKNHKQYDEVLSTIPKIKGHFNDYLRQGFYPFQQEDPISYHEKLLRVIDKTIYEDIANFYNLKTVNLFHFKKILNFLASIPPGEISVHNIGRQLTIDDKTVMNYLINLQETGLVNLIYPAEGGNLGLRRPQKIFLNNTNLQYAIEGSLPQKIDIGSIRELFFVQSINNSENSVFYSKKGDYQVGEYLFEIGGKNKTPRQLQNEQSAYLVKDDIYISTKKEIPLFYFGLLY